MAPAAARAALRSSEPCARLSVSALPHTSGAALPTECNEHGEGSHVKDAKTPSEQAAVAMLAVYPVPQATVHNAESAISVTALPQTSADALLTEGNEQGRDRT